MRKKIQKKINKIFTKYILNEAKLKYPPIRKRQFELNYYLDNFKCILSKITSWSNLKLFYKNDTKYYHYKTISNEFNKWSNDGIFINAYNKFIGENYFKFKHVNKNKTMNLFVDVTKINNKYGVQNIGVNCEFKKKNITAIQLVCDEYKIPIGISFLKNKNIKGQPYKNEKKETPIKNTQKTLSNTQKSLQPQKNEKINSKEKLIRITKRSTLEHEIKGIQKTLNSIPKSLQPYKQVKLIGDKAYISKTKYNIFNKKINIITPRKKNNKKRKNSKKEIDLLKKRNCVEMSFASLKSSDRVYVRKDKNIKTYMGFFYMETFLHTLKMLNVYNDDILNVLSQ